MHTRYVWLTLAGLLCALLLAPAAYAATTTVAPLSGPPGTRFLFY